ncbi:Uma2 family endonuclease [Streptacidiphilus sp. ASG 303]|uniref:Uma2 family endonuclease n=1 Tax=Streptacidiphilus sp. ASG 303 TaxID=2896847 RepID=UPI001E3E7E71|nr:Uma2 family endonuclease [Streptacidiphilus sp. ASG 303]MCD0485121.1 Uma2 family endonuclease [Streptacidiphilus sp. ASG 303]
MDPSLYARLRAIADELPVTPPVWAVEIGAEGIVMMMSPVKRHELITFRLGRQLNDQLARTRPGVIAHSGPQIESVPLGRMRRPDLVVLPEAVLEEEDAFVDPADVLLVAEVVSASNPDNDYTQKTRDYPAMGIPLYLIVDPRKGTLSVLSDPGPGPDGQPRYRARHDHVFGDHVPVGPWTVDTTGFLTY